MFTNCWRAAKWPSRETAIRFKVEWVSSRIHSCRLKQGRSQRIILQFNKLINVIWQLVSSALGEVKAQFTLLFKSLFCPHADKSSDRSREGDDGAATTQHRVVRWRQTFVRTAPWSHIKAFSSRTIASW